MPMKGRQKHVDRLRLLSNADRTSKMVGRVLYVGADMIRAEAFQSISRGSVSGKNHKPSARGAPPNRDTGVLQGNIEARLINPALAEVSSNAPYAKIHEFGGTINHPGGTAYFMRDGKPVFVGKKASAAFMHLPTTDPHDIPIPARPYMRPARDKKEHEIRKLLTQELGKLVKRSGK
jgi:phage gpG-like protein